MTSEKKDLALKLLRIGAFQTKKHSPGGKGFPLKKHRDPTCTDPLSPYYLNLRTSDHPTRPGPLSADHVQQIAQLKVSQLREYGILDQVEAVAIVPDAWNPVGRAIASLLPNKVVHFPQKEEDGSFASIPTLRPITCALLDDVLTAGGSKLECIDTLRTAGAGWHVHTIQVLVDREEGGREELERRGYQVCSLLSILQLVAFYHENGLVSAESAEEILTYIEERHKTPQT